MKKFSLFGVIFLFLFPLMVVAQVGGGNIQFKSKAGDVVFSHESHVSTGAKCVDCHPKPFLTTEKRKKVTMAQMAKGESCGKCHNGKTAFSVKSKADCKTCHQK
ncbi:MAG: cytochrome c3 family protein [Calditerrivibrio sp.]|nr:cytochrome c3 family protein [Calditerrivibrio sp.]